MLDTDADVHEEVALAILTLLGLGGGKGRLNGDPAIDVVLV